jgi:hypothetical protein
MSVEAILNEVRAMTILERKQLITLIVDTLTEPDIDDEYDEAEWEEAVLMPILGDTLRPDGSIDVERLRQRGKPVSLEELYPDSDASDED